MPYSSRLLASLGLALLAWSSCSAQSPQMQDEASQIRPSPTVMEVSAQDGVQSLVSSAAQGRSESLNSPSSAEEETSALLSGSLQTSMTNPEATSAAGPQQSSGALPSASSMDPVQVASVSNNDTFSVVDKDTISSVVDSDTASSVIETSAISGSELPGDSSIIPAFTSGEHSSSQALSSMLSSDSVNSSLFVQSLSLEIQPSESLATDIIASESESVFPGNSAVENVDLSSTVQQSESTVASDTGMASASAARPDGSVSPGLSESSGIAPSPTVYVPSPSAAVPVPGGGSPSNQAGDGSSPKGQEEKQDGSGSGGGMSSGAKAAIGIFVTLACIGLAAMVVVLYRRNYFTSRNLKTLMKGGVRYQTHDDSMSYNDEGMLILPDRS